MSIVVLEKQDVLDFVAENPNQVIYGPDGTFYIPQRDGLWRKVEGTEGEIDVIFANELLSGTSRVMPPEEVSRLFSPEQHPATPMALSEVADELESRHVLTGQCWEARDFVRGERVESIDDLDALEAILPDGALDSAVERALNRCGVNPDTGALAMDYYSHDDLVSLFTYCDIQDWLERKRVNDFMQSENVKHDRDGFVSYMSEKVCESSWWVDAAHDKEMEVVDALVAEIESGARNDNLLPSYLYMDWGSMRTQLLERFVSDRVYVDPDVERAMDSWGEVCVDLFLTEGEEWNSDYSNIGLLYEAQQGHDLYEDALGHAMDNNGLSWFAQQRGLSRDVMLTASDEGVPGHEFYEELQNVSSSTAVMAVFCRLSLGDWISCVEAKEKGDPIVISGNTFFAGLVDPWNGGGSTLDMTLDGELVVPSVNVLDAALDPSGREAPRGPYGDVGLVSSRVYGYSVKSVYGTNESLYRPGSINASIATEVVGLLSNGGIGR